MEEKSRVHSGITQKSRTGNGIKESQLKGEKMYWVGGIGEGNQLQKSIAASVLENNLI